jgi:hypothetical protein
MDSDVKRGTCRYCKCELMSDGKCCVSCYRKNCRKCVCTTYSKSHKESLGEATRKGVPLRKCKWCKGTGWTMLPPPSGVDKPFVPEVPEKMPPNSHVESSGL